MTAFYVIKDKWVNSNTAAHGFGDRPERVSYVAVAVKADTARKAMNAAKRIDKSLSFSGINADRIYTEAEMVQYGYGKHVPTANAVWQI